MPQESGIPRWMPFFYRKNFRDVDQIQMCILQKHYGHIIIIVLYFYELLITSSTVSSISAIETALHNAFEMSDLGLLKQFLGLELKQNYDGIMVT